VFRIDLLLALRLIFRMVIGLGFHTLIGKGVTVYKNGRIRRMEERIQCRVRVLFLILVGT
jgi:hypothetical protein